MISLCALLHICSAISSAPLTDRIGINYGRVADNLLEPSRAVELIRSTSAGMVKIFDANAQVLAALKNSGLKVSIMVPNEEVEEIGSNLSSSHKWIEQNVLPYYPKTKINVVVIGNEILSYPAVKDSIWPKLVPAMENIYQSLMKYNLHKKIKVSTSLATDILGTSYPPSNGSFRSDIAQSIMKPMLKFISYTDSVFFINVYPYFAWASDQNISLAYVLFGSSDSVVKDGKFEYDNMLDAMLDAVFVSMEKLGYGDINIAVSETGWPSQGDESQTGATVSNAAVYNRRLVQKMLADPPKGTPRRPYQIIPTYIFSLFNENLKPGAATEKHWGLFYPDGSPVYAIDLTGKTKEAQYKSSVSPVSVAVQTNQNKNWCVASSDSSTQKLQSDLDEICGSNQSDCSSIQSGGACYSPNTLISHASYAINRYWQRIKSSNSDCSSLFPGRSVLTTVDPSYGSCVYSSD